MVNSVAYFVLGIFAMAIIIGIIIIIRNEITITTTYRLFKRKLKTKQRQRSNINSVKLTVDGHASKLINSEKVIA